jgi:flagellar basal body rod protein FlgF
MGFVRNNGGVFEQRRVFVMYSQYKTLFWAAAVCILLAATAGALYFSGSFPKVNTNASSKPANKDNRPIRPGSKKARLIMYDGTEIVLENAAIGPLAQKDGASIKIIGNGQLQYERLADLGKTGNVAIPGMNTIAIPKGGEYTIVLPDGTKVWINSDSKLSFPNLFYGSTRRVELTGEAYFEVAENKNAPFHVQANNLDVEVLGTHFNINAYLDKQTVEATLLEGKVRVHATTPLSATAAKPASGILMPGQQAKVTREGTITVKKEVNTQSVVAWKEGYFQFAESSLPEMMQQISRWYDIDVVYEDGIVPNMVMVGKYARASSLEEALNMLKLIDVRYRLNGRQLTILH